MLRCWCHDGSGYLMLNAPKSTLCACLYPHSANRAPYAERKRSSHLPVRQCCIVGRLVWYRTRGVVLRVCILVEASDLTQTALVVAFPRLPALPQVRQLTMAMTRATMPWRGRCQ